MGFESLHILCGAAVPESPSLPEAVATVGPFGNPRGINTTTAPHIPAETLPTLLLYLGASPTIMPCRACRPNLEDAIPSGMWQRLEAAGMRLWGASAYKGASRPDALWVPLSRHVANHESWLERTSKTQINGIILTGWYEPATSGP